jgi:guanylate kinase
VLRVELLDLQTRTVIESRGCEEVEDAVAAFQAMFPSCPSQVALAKRLTELLIDKEREQEEQTIAASSKMENKDGRDHRL